MKRVKTMTHSSVLQSLFLAGLILASAGAQAAVLPRITVTGVVGNSVYNVNGYTGSIAYDPSAWFGKSFTLELVVDAANTVKTTEPFGDIPGEFNTWQPITVDYRLTINGALALSGTDNRYSRIESFNNITVPADLTGLEAPPGIIGARTYDGYVVGASDIQLACFSGGTNNKCDGEPTDVYEGASIIFDYFWDTALHDAIVSANLPDPLGLDFTQGFGGADFNFWHYSQAAGGGDDIARIYLSATSVTVTPVPEAETYAMMLAGLGLVGWAARRRRTIRK
ncbi:MAG: FxDxF family PEP-CTERM protein [Thiobacillus sp.]|nr:FxDxF family PEP-CTERM protein [Thiobacillus sp.]